jgi:hypothetical protein
MGKGDVRKVLMRAGIERERIGEICAALPDEIDAGDIGEGPVASRHQPGQPDRSVGRQSLTHCSNLWQNPPTPRIA